MEKSTFSREYGIFLEQLVAARKRRGLTQKVLARRLRRTQSWVSKAERGERRIDVIELREICRALGEAFPPFVKRLEEVLSKSRGTRGGRTSLLGGKSSS